MGAAHRAKGRRGQVIVIAAVMLFVLGGLLALTVDVGQVFVWRARLQNAADAASLAGIHKLVRQRLEGVSEATARVAAASEATLIEQANVSDAGISIQFGKINAAGNFETVDGSTSATAVLATASRDSSAPGGSVRLAFAPLLGINRCPVAGTGVAEVTSSIRGVLTGLAPFAVPEERLVPPGQEMVFYPADGEAYDGLGDVTVAPGCWGLLNLDGGALSTTELIEWIENGYNGLFEISEDGYIWIDGTSGFRAALQKPMRAKIGETLIMVVYDVVTGTGSNAQFRCVGFMRGTILEVKLTGKNERITCRVEQIGMLHGLVSGGNNNSPNILKIQLIR